MTLHDITVKKFIQLHTIVTECRYLDKIDEEVALLSCIEEKPESYFLEMKLPAYRKEREKLGVITLDNVQAKAAKYISANGKKYAPVFVFDKLTAGQMLDAMHFLKEPDKIIENLPQILACFCVPTTKSWRGTIKKPYLSIPHDEVSRDMEAASILDAYGIALFFCDVLKRFLVDTKGCLIEKMMKMKAMKGEELTTAEIKALLTILEVYGDGITQPNK